ncbi:uncharacterized protein F4807DRAFT_407488 [Annulohypoxylon truncatum]|uniref:uncharacterized protein n=1 Tax=Annulohypoxylon truncatum TaxID=327061 RepID=UPI002007F09C|nr:uncharacterized protein F4807DRAFT_407488 [Annulohypoxylon truncatum]KAI1214302.1 hypothetical protein F4807DRAFT_407488 [Annulohypoxylon truncatum]
MAFRTRGIRHEATQFLARKVPLKPGMENDVRLMSYLWLSQSRKALVFEYNQNRGYAKVITFDEGFRFFDAGAIKRGHPDSDSEGDDPEEKSKLDVYTEKEDIEQTIKLFHHILGRIKEQAEAHAEQGTFRFAIKQTRKVDKDFQVVTDAPHLAVSLLSPVVIDQIRKVETDSSEDSGSSANSDPTEERSEVLEDSDDSEQGGASGTNEGARSKRIRLDFS